VCHGLANEFHALLACVREWAKGVVIHPVFPLDSDSMSEKVEFHYE
jgi:hypothetical protein